MIKQQRIVNGYDLEELYFERLNRALIQNLRGTNTAPQVNPQQKQPPGAQVIQFPKRRDETKKKAA